jgi:hypothetical protein
MVLTPAMPAIAPSTVSTISVSMMPGAAPA